MPPRCAACPADMCADHSLRLAQEVVAQNHFLCLLWLGGERGGKSGVTEQDGLAADGKGVFLVRLRPGKLDKLLVHQIVKGNLPLPFPAKLQNLIAGSIADYCLTKGVVLALDVLLIGFKVGHGNSPSLNNSAGRQHSLLSPLDCLSAKAGGAVNGGAYELHPKSWTRKSTKGVQKSMGKELFSEELKLAVVQYVLEGHTCKEASEKFCVSCTPIEKWVNLYKLHGAKGLLSRNLVGRQKGFDGEFRLKVLQYKQEHHLSCTQTAMHFCLDVVTVCRWEKKFQKEGARGLMKKQATKGSEKRQKKQEQSELQQENKRLSEENYRLRMENDYLKKLNALIQKREKPE